MAHGRRGRSVSSPSTLRPCISQPSGSDISRPNGRCQQLHHQEDAKTQEKDTREKHHDSHQPSCQDDREPEPPTTTVANIRLGIRIRFAVLTSQGALHQAQPRTNCPVPKTEEEGEKCHWKLQDIATTCHQTKCDKAAHSKYHSQNHTTASNVLHRHIAILVSEIVPLRQDIHGS